EWVGVVRKLITDGEIAEFRRVHLPLHRVASRPVAAGACTDIHRHADAIAGIETRAAHLRQVPAGPEIARAPLRVGLETAAREHDRFATQLTFGAVVPDAHAADPDAVMEQAERPRAVANLDAAFGRRIGEHRDKAGSAADGLDGEAAPELELPLDLECLAAVDRNEAYALLAYPAERVEASRHQQFDQIRIGAILRHSRHVIEKLLSCVCAEVGGGNFLVCQIRHQRLDVVDAVINDAHRSGGEAAVAAGVLLRSSLPAQAPSALIVGPPP